MSRTSTDHPSSPPCGQMEALHTDDTCILHFLSKSPSFTIPRGSSPSEIKCLLNSHNFLKSLSPLWNNIVVIVRPLWSVSVWSLSLLLDFLPKVHGEGGHGVGGQDDDGAAHKVRGAAPPGRKPQALPVQVRVCRLHGVRQGLHASG